MSDSETLGANPATAWTLRTERNDLGQTRSKVGAICTVPDADHTESLHTRALQLDERMSALQFDQNVFRFGKSGGYGARRTNFFSCRQNQIIDDTDRRFRLNFN